MASTKWVLHYQLTDTTGVKKNGSKNYDSYDSAPRGYGGYKSMVRSIATSWNKVEGHIVPPGSSKKIPLPNAESRKQ